MLCGARQAVVSYVILFILWFFLKSGKLKLQNIVLVTLIGILFYLFLSNLEVEFLQKMFDSKGSLEQNMNRNIDYPLELVKDVPIWGIGFGNYLNPYTFEWYPHNILLEIIIEMGVIGSVMILVIIITFCKRNKSLLFHKLPNGAYATILITPYIMRSMISEHIGTNFAVFLVLFLFFIDNNYIKS